MTSPTSTDIGSVQSNIFSDNHICSPASSIELSPNHKSKVAPKLCCSSDNKLRPECKSQFVEALVDSAAIILETVWPCATDTTCYIRQALSLKRFIQETLRRSRTCYSTLQLALYYIIQIKSFIYEKRAYNRKIGNLVKCGDKLGLRCGRRAFLAALMIAGKYIQDRNYSVRAWSKISGLPVNELCENEQLFLSAMGWNAHVKYAVYERWSGVLFECACDYSESKKLIWEERFRTLAPCVTGVESWRSSILPTVCQDNTGKSCVRSTALTSANLENFSGGSKNPLEGSVMKRKAVDDDTLPNKRLAASKHDADATKNRVHEWTECVATHLMQGIHDPLSVQM